MKQPIVSLHLKHLSTVAAAGIRSKQTAGIAFIYHDLNDVAPAEERRSRRELDFESIGGLWTDLPSNFNDVDFSYKVRGTWRRLVWLSEVRVTHFESRSRDTIVTGPEIQAVLNRWVGGRRSVHVGRGRAPGSADEAVAEG